MNATYPLKFGAQFQDAINGATVVGTAVVEGMMLADRRL